VNLYKEVASTLGRAGRTIDAAEFYQGYIDATQSTESADFLQLGIYHYQVAGQLARKVSAAEKAIEAEETVEVSPAVLKDSLNQFVGNAVEAFGKVVELIPESYQGTTGVQTPTRSLTKTYRKGWPTMTTKK